MKNDDVIKKWLAGELTDSERDEFEGSQEFAGIARILKSVERFRAPEYNSEVEYSRLSESIFNRKRTIPFYQRMTPVFKVAAVILLGLIISYFSFNYFESFSDHGEWISEQAEIYLPDSSFVILNADSRIRYSEKKWKKKRKVELNGEAFFSVKEGVSFRVQTEHGQVTVLGTEFTVKDWEHYYQVTCYSGSVQVISQERSVVLQPNSAFRNIQGNKETFAFYDQRQQPDWLHGESSFRSVPLQYVIDEFERQYRVSVETMEVNTERLFTGSFSHDDIETAIRAITVPANLRYEINGNKIVITFEGK